MFNRNQISTGMQTYTMDGHQIGTVGEIGETHFKTDTGFMGLGKDLFIPFDTIDHVTENKVYLNVTKDRVNMMNWDRQPTGWMR